MAEEIYYEYAVISQEDIDISKIDYYLQKDTFQENEIIKEYYPDRAITPTKTFKTNNRITYYELTQAEADKIFSNPDVYSVYYSLDYITSNTGSFPSFSVGNFPNPEGYGVAVCSTQNEYFSIVADNDSNPSRNNQLINSVFRNDFPSVNWGLRWHTTYKDKINWTEMFMLNTSSYQINLNKLSYNYNLDGKGVDLVILDTGVKFHPEFLDENNNLRIVEYDWYQHLDATNPDGTKKELPLNFYTTQSGGHGTHVASIAAGRISGWAKGASIYSLKCVTESGFGQLWATIVQPQTLMTLAEGLEAIRLFHESKPIDPSTGFKRPTIVNASLATADTIVNFVVNSNQNLYNISSTAPTGFHQVVYRGNVVQTGSGLPSPSSFSLKPSLRYAIKAQTDYNDPFFYNYYYQITVPIVLDEFQVLCKQMEDAGVVLIRSAGNEQNVVVREPSPNYPQYHNDLYYSSLKKTTATDFYGANVSIPTNRLGSPYSEKTVIVGSISPFGVIPGPKITTPNSPSSGSFTYDMYGTSNKGNALQPYWHGNVTKWISNAIKGIGSGSIFPGWDTYQASASIALSSFTNIGPAVDIFAAGGLITAAGHPFYNWYNSTYQAGTYPVKNYNLYNPNYNPNINPNLDSTDYMVTLSGTSMSSPQVAGIACLYFQLNPGATVKQFKQFLSASAIKTPQMQVFNEDPTNNPYYSGSITYNTSSDFYGNQRIYPISVQFTASLALYGAPPLIVHWPYSNPNPASFV
jgi:subtilisin family serine protease